MTETTEEYNGIKFVREDIEDGMDITLAVDATEIVDLYTKHWEMGYVITSLTLTEEGSMLMNARKIEED